MQLPDRPAEVAVVPRGPKGSGEGTLAQIMSRLFRQHALQISNPAHLTGRFKGHLVDVLFLFVDEAFWAGGKAGEGYAQGPAHRTNHPDRGEVRDPVPGGQPTHDGKQCRLGCPPPLMTSVVTLCSTWQPADAAIASTSLSCIRRSTARKLPAFLDYLLRLDLTDYDFRNPPHTAGLSAQKLARADSVIKFWLDCLTSGEIVGANSEGLTIPDPDAASWPEDVVAQVLHAAYVDHAHAHSERCPLTDCHMAKKLAGLLPADALKTVRSRIAYGDTKRPTRYILPDLNACRAAFLQAIRIADYPWPVE